MEFRINKGVLGISKDVSHRIWEFRGPPVPPHTTKSFHDLHRHLQVPVTPPTLADVCKLIELYYVLKVSEERATAMALAVNGYWPTNVGDQRETLQIILHAWGWNVANLSPTLSSRNSVQISQGRASLIHQSSLTCIPCPFLLSLERPLYIHQEYFG